MAIPAPEFEYIESVRYDTVASDPSTGPVFRHAIHEKQRRRFRLEWQRASIADKDALLTEIQSTKGAAGTVSYTPVDEVSAITARFVDDSLRWEWVAPNRVRMSIVLEEEVA